MLPFFNVGEVALFAYNFAPVGFLACEGQEVFVQESVALFKVIGNRFGGDASQGKFALPDYRQSIPAAEVVEGNKHTMVRKGLRYCIATEGGFPREGHVPCEFRYIAGVSLFAFDVKDWGTDWIPCDGRKLDIRGNQAVFSLLGNRFGGDARTNFAVPDLTKNAPSGSRYALSLQGNFPSPGDRARSIEALTGEVRLFPYEFEPSGWFQCNGLVLPIMQHTALFALMGNTFGGDARTTFALPDLRKSAPAGMKYCIAAIGGHFPPRP